MSSPKQKARTKPADKLHDHLYLNPDGSVDGEKLLALLRQTPGTFHLIAAHRVLETRPLHEHDIGGLIEGLTTIAILAAYGDEKSITQLKAIEKLIRAPKYCLPFTKLREIIDRYETSPPLARAWELRQLMSCLCWVVAPIRPKPPYSIDQPVKLIQPSNSAYVELSELAQRHIKRNSTLQSLAISIYLEQLRNEGVTDENNTITERTLKADLTRAREWDKTVSEEDKVRRGTYKGLGLHQDSPITWYAFSDEWKERTKARKRSSITANTKRGKRTQAKGG
jgi:hypothetical protein